MFRRALLPQTRRFTPQALFRSTPSSFSSAASRTELSRVLKSSSFRYPTPARFQRWQSTDTEKKSENDAGSSTGSSPGGSQPEAENPLQKELDQKTQEVIDLKDKYLRSVADFRNLQERTRRDIDASRQFAIQRFATDLIESLDNLDRALDAVPAEALTPIDEDASNSSDSASEGAPTNSNKDLINLHAGLTMTESILMSTLKKHGLESFDPQEQGRKFDPRLDEATFMTKVEGREDGDVFHTQSKGFTLNGRVLRAAKVGVVKNSTS